jgi:hypothetical protein
MDGWMDRSMDGSIDGFEPSFFPAQPNKLRAFLFSVPHGEPKTNTNILDDRE